MLQATDIETRLLMLGINAYITKYEIKQHCLKNINIVGNKASTKSYRLQILSVIKIRGAADVHCPVKPFIQSLNQEQKTE